MPPARRVLRGRRWQRSGRRNGVSTRGAYVQPRAMQEMAQTEKGPAPCGTAPLSEAGEGARTLDIHVGNVTLYH